MRKAVPFLLLLALAGCGESKKAAPTPTPQATAAAASAESLKDYPEGVRRYYTGADLEAADDPNADAEIKYFQPPRPARARLGEKVRLTGSNIGVQVDVTPKSVKTVEAGGKQYTAVEVELSNAADGITVYDGELRNASLTYAGGKPLNAVWGVKAPCSNTFDGHVRLDVGEVTTGCLLFPRSDAAPEELRISAETVPTDAGGTWAINPR